jgi:hypothetical protein
VVYLAKKKIKRQQKAPVCHNNLFSCLCSWQESIFFGLVIFVIGLMIWFSKTGLLNPDLLTAMTTMVVGIMFAVKGAFFSYFRG